MESCKGCLFYNAEFSDFVKEHADSYAENEKPNEYFCSIFLDGIPEDIWKGEKVCGSKVDK